MPRLQCTVLIVCTGSTHFCFKRYTLSGHSLIECAPCLINIIAACENCNMHSRFFNALRSGLSGDLLFSPLGEGFQPRLRSLGWRSLSTGKWIFAERFDFRCCDPPLEVLMREANLVVGLDGVGRQHADDAAHPRSRLQPSEIRFQDHQVSSRIRHSAHGIPLSMGRRNTKGRDLTRPSPSLSSSLPVHPWSA